MAVFKKKGRKSKTAEPLEGQARKAASTPDKSTESLAAKGRKPPGKPLTPEEEQVNVDANRRHRGYHSKFS